MSCNHAAATSRSRSFGATAGLAELARAATACVCRHRSPMPPRRCADNSAARDTSATTRYMRSSSATAIHSRYAPYKSLDSQSMAHSPSAPAINASARWKATAGHGATRGPVKSFSTYIKTAASPPAPPSGLASFVGQSSAGSPRFPAAMRSPASVRSRAEVQWEVRACAGCGRPR